MGVFEDAYLCFSNPPSSVCGSHSNDCTVAIPHTSHLYPMQEERGHMAKGFCRSSPPGAGGRKTAFTSILLELGHMATHSCRESENTSSPCIREK